MYSVQITRAYPVHATTKLLKKDLFGEVWLAGSGENRHILRDTRAASVWVRPLARWLLRREARVLAALSGIEGVPALIASDRMTLDRSYIDGRPMQAAKPRDAAYFRDARRLLRRLHRAGVVHNDLAKEPNLLVTADGSAAFIDFQLAGFFPRRGRLFRLLAREDIRHLLKHKRTYCPLHLSPRETRLLESPSAPSRLYMRTVKPVYLFVTRRLLGWADREGAGDRGARR